MKRIDISVSSNFNKEAEPDKSPHSRAYEHLRLQVLNYADKILTDDPCAEMGFSVDLDDSVWIKSRYLHKIAEEVFDLRRKHAKINPYLVSDRADNSGWLDFRERFQTVFTIGEHANQLIITERLRTKEDIDSKIPGIHGVDEIYDRDRPTPSQIPSP